MIKGITEQDKKIAEHILASHASTVVVVNKWDMIEGEEAEYEEYVREKLAFLKYVPIVFISAKTGIYTHSTIIPLVFIQIIHNSLIYSIECEVCHRPGH